MLDMEALDGLMITESMEAFLSQQHTTSCKLQSSHQLKLSGNAITMLNASKS